MTRAFLSPRSALRIGAIALCIAFSGCECNVRTTTQPAASPAPAAAPAATYSSEAPPPAPEPMRRSTLPAQDAGH
jgi:hypothetical protein